MSAEKWAVWCPSCKTTVSARVMSGVDNLLLHDDGEHVALVRHDILIRALDGGWQGYQATCEGCGWSGAVHSDKSVAQDDAAEHAPITSA